jgi:gliding motility-associated-like protein
VFDQNCWQVRRTGTLNLGISIRFIASALTIFSYSKNSAQLCTSSVGDPVVKITFGQNAITSLPPYVPSTLYSYTSSTCPVDGSYTITNRTSNCFGNTWHTVTSDHTGRGNFLLINAAYVAGDVFFTTISGLCPNTSYEVSAWMMNVVKTFNSIRPEIVFRMEKPDGTILAFYEAGELPVTAAPTWEQYGFVFTSPPDNSPVVLRITDTWPGGAGNDFAVDDIAFRPCGPKITASILANPDTLNICEGNNNQYTLLGNASTLYQSPIYQWQVSNDSGSTWRDISGATSDSYIRQPTSQPGNYSYRLMVVDASVAGNPNCRVGSNVVVVNVHPKPIADAGPDRVYLNGNPVILAGNAEGENISYFWEPTVYMTDPNSLNPTVSPPSDIMYTLKVQSDRGCINKDSVLVKYAPGIFVPNAFTPNGDGVNDQWHISFLDPGLGAEVHVFNRWGQVVYHSLGGTVSWDGRLNGKPQPAGVYVFIINFKKGNLPNMKGLVTLIR